MAFKDALFFACNGYTILMLTSGNVKASLTVHDVFVDPKAVPGSHVTQTAVTHSTLKQTQAFIYIMTCN